MLCRVCGEAIPTERLEALPGCDTCIQCSRSRRKVGFMVSAFSKGTAPELMFVPESPEAQRIAARANKRSR